MSTARVARARASVPRAAWLQLAAAIVLFGLTWPVMKIGLMAGTPIWLAAGRATMSALTASILLTLLGRLKWPPREDWPVILSVGTLQLSSFFALANLGVQSVPPGRSGVLAYTTMLWMVPLSLLVGEKVGWRSAAGVVLGFAGVVVLADPDRFDWHDRRIVMGHVYLLLAGFTWALAILHTRHHRWRGTPLDALPWQMSVATVLLWLLALVAEPAGYLDFGKWQLWLALLYIGAFAGPAGTWAAVSVTRALPPITTALGMLGVPLVGIVSSIVLLGEPVTLALVLGTTMVIAGIAIVIVGKDS
ncbi:DMT family transporter [Reyranella sp.]|jgi:drug/metabolite transporter (DMT)-like permease|uniref:DMT family transporter n=1 Tax=Reyranella sp. TaxID=1929291 RepID=UPI002F940730